MVKSSALKIGSVVYVTNKKGVMRQGKVIDRWLDYLSVIFDNGKFKNVHCTRVNFARIRQQAITDSRVQYSRIVEVTFHSRDKRNRPTFNGRF